MTIFLKSNEFQRTMKGTKVEALVISFHMISILCFSDDFFSSYNSCGKWEFYQKQMKVVSFERKLHASHFCSLHCFVKLIRYFLRNTNF